MLTHRRQKLLQVIIDEYVSTAQPVGSHALVEKYGLGVSSATIRNEMAHLEEEGYIAQPHTSAGRVPTDAGYRYYVEALMREEQVPPELQSTIRHQFHQAARELEEWARLAAAIMAARLNNAAVVTTPHSPRPKLRWLELVGVHDYLALLVVVLQEARVLQQTLALERPFSQEELTAVARKLNDLLAGKTAAQMKALSLEASPVETAVVESAATMLKSVEDTDAEPSFLEGMRDLLRQPEFTQGGRILGLLEHLEERNLSRAIPLASDDRQTARTGGAVHIIIGGEHPVDALRICSVISAHYTGPGELRGTLSVVGPTRMHYARAVSTVRYMSSLMAELLGVYFA